MSTTKTTWTTWGPVRGSCDHAHRTEQAAEQCLERDRRGCKSQGGYSDRGIHVTTCERLHPDGRRCTCPHEEELRAIMRDIYAREEETK